MTNFKQISSNLISVTPEQIGAAHLVHIDGVNFYQVQSAHSIEEYDVKYSRELGYTCSCKSGQNGFANVKHPSGVCWHVRAAIAAQIEEKSAMVEQIALNTQEQPTALLVDGKPADSATVARVMNAQPSPVKRVPALPQTPKFEMMKRSA